ncbi:MAG: sigma-70 family RNA polymerase sigma factor [Planctomycetaceae bacterium]|nr:sigma-70 family RNA polymerase sigma factor [Planctomycetaceae bacterium]
MPPQDARPDAAPGGPGRGFPETHWSVIAGAKDRTDPRWRERVEQLARLYWRPIYRHLRIRWRMSEDEAGDATQEFFGELLEGRYLREVAESRGRFRAYVKVCLDNAVRQSKRAGRRLKRGGGAAIVPLDAGEEGPLDPPDPGESPEASLDREWRRALVAEAVGRLRAAYAAEGKEGWYEVFRRVELADGERPTYREVAGEMGIRETDVENRLAHARKRLFEVVREVVAESVGDGEGLEGEMRELFPG